MNSRWKSIIELGCGTGKNTSFLSQIAEKVYAVDFSEGMLSKAKEKVNSSSVVFSLADITKKWAYDDRFADLVVCNLVLEHTENLSFIFSEAFRSLDNGGRFFISELHPFRQYQGKKASFQKGKVTTEIAAFTHHISDFLDAAETSGFKLKELKEWWHEEDINKVPRLVTFVFEK
jgi:malonyl-CoA O-methyltransferase